MVTPIIQNLTSKNLPLDEDKARKLKKIYAKYTLVARKLYIIGRSTPMLRCLCMNETILVLMEVCIGVSGIPIGGRTFLNELLRIEYYWITFQRVNIDFVKKYAISVNNFHTYVTPQSRSYIQWPLHGHSTFEELTFWDSSSWPQATKILTCRLDYFTKKREAKAVLKVIVERVRCFY